MTGTATGKGRLKAAWTLVILAPVCAELTFTAVAIPATWIALPLLIVMYGAGVLLIREAVARVGGGWASLAVLGVAYEIAEDGLGLQALTSPDMYDIPEWGLRVAGLNPTYWEAQIGVHVVFSVLLPVMLTDVMFPRLRGRAYLRTGGLAGVAALAVVGVVGLRFGIAPNEDPGYQVPWGLFTGFVVAIALLAVIALRLLPGRTIRVKPLKPSPVGLALLGALAPMLFLGLIFPFYGEDKTPVFGDTVPLLVLPMIGSAIIAAAAAWTVLRWAAHPQWNDFHRLWLAGGLLVGHTLYMMIGDSPVRLLTGTVTIGFELVLLWLIARSVRRRADADATGSAATTPGR